MYQVPIGGYQLVVVAAHELRPGEIRVAGLRHVDGEIIAKGIGVIALQIVGEPDSPVAARRKLAVLQTQELVGGNIIGQIKSPVAPKVWPAR